MKKIRLFNYLWPSYFVIAITMLIVVALYATTQLKKQNRISTQNQLENIVSLSVLDLKEVILHSDQEDVESRVDEIAKNTDCRLTVVLPNGDVLSDSTHDITKMGNHADRPEVQRAFRQEFASSTRFSETKQKSMMYVAKAIYSENRNIAVVRASKPISRVYESSAELSQRIFVFCLFATVLTFFFSLTFARKISRPLDLIGDWAEDYAENQFQKHIPASGILEIDAMADTINLMVDQLKERLNTISEQQGEENALFPNMIEGVFTVDQNHCVLKLNNTTQELFDIVDYKSSDPVETLIRHPEIHKMVKDVIDSKTIVQREIHLAQKDKYLQVNGNVLTCNEGDSRGALFVINDITELRKMEMNHRELVANVSHELKTPITSIIGFSETLVENKDMEEAEKDHFLDIIYRQSSRLQNIVEDLLQLTSLEHEAESGQVKLYDAPIRYVLESAAQCCQSKVGEKSIHLNISCESNLHGKIDLNLLDQALINLLDNAIKYSEPSSTISLTAEKVAEEIRITVEDQGCGIAKEHHEKLFSRFYVVDKSRSRKLGGTGLGLAIVKHIVLAHKGRVEVDSQVGVGTKFSIILPHV